VGLADLLQRAPRHGIAAGHQKEVNADGFVIDEGGTYYVSFAMTITR
jgi:hypothetical protein